jgi:cyanophycinase
MIRLITMCLPLILLSACTKTELAIIDEQDAVNAAALKVDRYLTGDPADVVTSTQGGTVLMGGSTDVDAAIEWMIDRSGGGDFVVLRVTGTDGYNDYIYTDLGGVNSVETVVITSKASANKIATYNTIINAEAVFIAGGDQWDYVNYWKDTKVEDALNYLINTKHVPVGGTSAGCAIQGKVYFDAKFGTVTSTQALNNPYRNLVSLQRNNFIDNPLLINTITDTHYNNPDRKGRQTTFLARMAKDWAVNAKGIGVEEQTAVCIDEAGLAKVFGTNSAYFLKQNGLGPETCISGSPLTWDRSNQAIKTYKVPGTITGSNSFNISNWTTGFGGTWWYFSAESGTFIQNLD